MSKKVLITASGFGHIVQFHLPYLEQFRRTGWEVHVACGGEETRIPYADRIIPLNLEKRIFAFSNLEASAALRSLMRSEKYDLVITHTSLASFFTRLAEKGIRNRPHTIVVVHGYLFGPDIGRFRERLLQAAEHYVAAQTDAIVTMNDWDKKWAEKNFPRIKRYEIPGIGIDTKRLQRTGNIRFPISSEDFVLVFPGEFSERKNQAMLIRAMKRLPDQVKLLLPGDGKKIPQCRELAASLGLEKRVWFTGYLDTVGDAYRCADAAVSPARSEGLPFCLMEAMYCGLPIIASDVKGNSDLVKEGVNGYLYPFGDEQAFADRVLHMMKDRTMARKMGRTGREMADQYILDHALPYVFRIYEEESGIRNGE